MIRSIALLFSGLFFAFCMSPTKHIKSTTFPETPKTWFSEEFSALNGQANHKQASSYEKSIVLLENKNNLLPLGNLDIKTAHVSIGGNPTAFHKGLDRFVTSDELLNTELAPETMREWATKSNHDVVFLSLHASKKTHIDSINTLHLWWSRNKTPPDR